MHLQAASRRELRRIAAGTAICTAAMWVVFAALHLVNWAPFDWKVLLSGALGACVAIVNFWGICVTVQRATGDKNEKHRRAAIQVSYNMRMLAQALWVLLAVVLPVCFQWVAAVVPLAFPRIVIYYLQATGRYKPENGKGAPEANAEETSASPAPEAGSDEAQGTPPHEEGGEI